MKYAVYTDIGTKKEINQDSLIVMEADSVIGNILMAAVCDGMGGLAAGEKASQIMVETLERWFTDTLPALLDETGMHENALRQSLMASVQQADTEVAEYGDALHADCGTTVTALIVTESRWYAVNVGDSRLYIVEDGQIRQETVDHSYIQREIDAGRMTREEAEVSDMRNVLTQCIGAGDVVMPDWYSGDMQDSVFLLCSDGYRNCNPPSTLEKVMQPANLKNEKTMQGLLTILGERAMKSGETDNLSAILIG